MNGDLAGFRRFILSKHPNISEKDLRTLDNFIEGKGGIEEPTEEEIQLENVENLVKQSRSAWEGLETPGGIKGKAARAFEGTPKSGLLKFLGIDIPSLGELGGVPTYTRYRAARALTLSPLARVLQKEKGPLTEEDIARASEAIPQGHETKTQAEKMWAEIQKAIGVQKGEKKEKKDDPLGIL